MSDILSDEYTLARKTRAKREGDFDRDERDILLALRDLTTLVQRLDLIDMRRIGCVGRDNVALAMLAAEQARSNLKRAADEMKAFGDKEMEKATDAHYSKFFTENPNVNPE